MATRADMEHPVARAAREAARQAADGTWHLDDDGQRALTEALLAHADNAGERKIVSQAIAELAKSKRAEAKAKGDPGLLKEADQLQAAQKTYEAALKKIPADGTYKEQVASHLAAAKAAQAEAAKLDAHAREIEKMVHQVQSLQKGQ